MQTTEEILKQCIIENNIVKLPDVKLDRKLYLEVSKSIELIGGKWKGGKIAGFVFETDPTYLFNKISGNSGEIPEKVNLKKEFQFFPTPKEIVDYIVDLADIKDNDIILEPSAGQGAIIEGILRKNKNANIFAIELMELNSDILNKKGFNHEKGNFLLIPNQPIYTKIIANPPFSKNQDIDHVYRMWECLAVGGRIITITSKHWIDSKNKKETEFKNWLNVVGAEQIEIEKGAFKESGTNISSLILIIDKK